MLQRADFKPTGASRYRRRIGRRGKEAAKHYIVILTDKLFDLMGVGRSRFAV